MKSFELINYNFDEQRIDLRVFHPVKNGYIIAKDIDLDATIYKMKIWDVQPGLHVLPRPLPEAQPVPAGCRRVHRPGDRQEARCDDRAGIPVL